MDVKEVPSYLFVQQILYQSGLLGTEELVEQIERDQALPLWS